VSVNSFSGTPCNLFFSKPSPPECVAFFKV
jgi:hypothetical protein